MKLTTILTKRQNEVFMLMAQGYTERQIAEKLNVSLASVSKVLHNVYDKLEAHNAINALREALLNGLLKLEDLQRQDKD
ncbi:MAG: response regulator transcription factor [Synergistaceae bacterium]|nr:response regulator transcription factor [Synergistaceae bacterium]